VEDCQIENASSFGVNFVHFLIYNLDVEARFEDAPLASGFASLIAGLNVVIPDVVIPAAPIDMLSAQENCSSVVEILFSEPS
jgi:hypothetical protein